MIGLSGTMRPPRKMTFRNPLSRSLKRKSITGRYDFLPDNPSDDKEDSQLGTVRQDDTTRFLHLDDDDDTPPWPDNSDPCSTLQLAADEPFYFEATFDDIPILNKHRSSIREQGRVVSSYFERSSKPRSTPPRPQHPRSDGDTSGTADTEESFEAIHSLPKQRTIRFADEEGMAIQTVHVTERDDDEGIDGNRVIVLLLCPKRKRFEFLHVQYSWDERTQLSEAFKQFPFMASDPCFINQNYIGMCRPWRGGEELINSLALQDYDMHQDEILVAIPSGMKSKQIMKLSKPLLSNKNVIKTVKRKMRNGFAVQKLQLAAGEKLQAGHNDEIREHQHRDLGTASDAVKKEFKPAPCPLSKNTVLDLSVVKDESITDCSVSSNQMNNNNSSREVTPAVDDDEHVVVSIDDDAPSGTEAASDMADDDVESVPDMDRYLSANQMDSTVKEKAAKVSVPQAGVRHLAGGSFLAKLDGTGCGQVTVDGMVKVTKTRDNDKSSTHRFQVLNASVVAVGFLYQIMPGALRKKRSSRTMAEI